MLGSSIAEVSSEMSAVRSLSSRLAAEANGFSVTTKRAPVAGVAILVVVCREEKLTSEGGLSSDVAGSSNAPLVDSGGGVPWKERVWGAVAMMGVVDDDEGGAQCRESML